MQSIASCWRRNGNRRSDGVNFAAIVCEVDKHLAPDATVTSDAGNFGSFIHRYIGFKPGQIFLSAVVGAMGSGMPMAVAATLRRPGKQVVAFMGDGGALMAGNEIATAYAVWRCADRHHFRQPDVWHDRHAPSRALSGSAVPGIDEADQSGLCCVGTFVWRGRHYHPGGIRGGGWDRARIRGEDQASGGALPHLCDADELRGGGTTDHTGRRPASRSTVASELHPIEPDCFSTPSAESCAVDSRRLLDHRPDAGRRTPLPPCCTPSFPAP